MTDQPEDPKASARRHPAQVTVDRLADHVLEYGDMLTVRDMAAIGRVVDTLTQIAEGKR